MSGEVGGSGVGKVSLAPKTWFFLLHVVIYGSDIWNSYRHLTWRIPSLRANRPIKGGRDNEPCPWWHHWDTASTTVEPTLCLDFLLLNFSSCTTSFNSLFCPWIHAFSPVLFLEVTKNSYASHQLGFPAWIGFIVNFLFKVILDSKFIFYAILVWDPVWESFSRGSS